MSDHDGVIANDTGAAVRADLNLLAQALINGFSGTSAPAAPVALQIWNDTTNLVRKQRNAANTGWLVRETIGETFVVSRSSNTILALADWGKSFIATSTFTQTLTAAATLADGWYVDYRNNGTGVITIDPNSSETIDGTSTTLVLNPGEGCRIWCNGTGFTTTGLGLMRGSAGLIDNLSIACSVGSSALTIALKTRNGNDATSANPIKIPFRNVTAATGDYAEMPVAAASSLVVSSGSTLGARSGVPFRLWFVGFNDGGTFRLGVINCVTSVAGAGSGSDVTAIYPLGAWPVASSTAEGGAGAADSAQVFYTGSGVTSKAYSVLGYATWESGLATAGTWDAAPTRIQLFEPNVPLPGRVVQTRRTPTGALGSGTTTVPYDDTIPQSGEGTEFMTQAITPTSTANVLAIESLANLRLNATDTGIVGALYQDAVANALTAQAHYPVGASSQVVNHLRHLMLAATTSATTFKVRAGPSSAATLNFNGDGSGARVFGGVMNSFIEAVEVMG
jgi:hypothetical protein